jgi:lipoprotein-anchoring transpeptidase ErfK/SrfK
MSDDIERRLAAAFDARAREAFDDRTPPPAPRYATETRPPRRLVRVLAPLAAAAAVAAIVAGVVTVAHSSSSGGDHPAAAPSTTAAATSVAPATTPVHISLLNADGDQYGVGMPVIAYFSKRITDARGLQKATTVTVNGAKADGAWYFEPSKAGNGPIEGHLRLPSYWPAHAHVHVGIAAKHVSGGGDLAFDNDLSLDFTTGARNIAVVNDSTHTMSVFTDGKQLFDFPVSLGAKRSPTSSGTKVIMEKGVNVCMKGTGYDECGIKYTQRLTYGGEFLHAAPWNVQHIQTGVDSSNGCTNLMPTDARRLYDTLRVGDVVQYPKTDGAPMTLGAGYGDWNVHWVTWLTGGAVRTR